MPEENITDKESTGSNCAQDGGTRDLNGQDPPITQHDATNNDCTVLEDPDDFLQLYFNIDALSGETRRNHESCDTSPAITVVSPDNTVPIVGDELQLHIDEVLSDLATCSPTDVQVISFSPEPELQQEKNAYQHKRFALPTTDSHQVLRGRNVDLHDNDVEPYQGFPDGMGFNSTEEEERYLEEFRRGLGPWYACAVRKPPDSHTQDDSQVQNISRKRKITDPVNTNTTQQANARRFPATSQSQNSQSTPRPQATPPQPRPLTGSPTAAHFVSSPHQVAVSRADSVMLQNSGETIPNHLPAKSNHPNNTSIQSLLKIVTPIDLTQPRLTDRCRGMEYIPFRTDEELQQLRENHIKSLHRLVTRLRAAIVRRLGVVEDNDPRISVVGRALYVGAIKELQSVFLHAPELFTGLGNHDYQVAQLMLLNRLMRRLDLDIRPNGPVHLQNSLIAWYVAAMQWQIDIHEEWIAELESWKKRKRGRGEENSVISRDGGDIGQSGMADGQATLREKAPCQQRRPGRPPGSLNKSTIAAQSRQATRGPKKQKTCTIPLPPLSKDDLHLAQASAAHYANQSARSAYHLQHLSSTPEAHTQTRVPTCHQQLAQRQEQSQLQSQDLGHPPTCSRPHDSGGNYRGLSTIQSSIVPRTIQEARSLHSHWFDQQNLSQLSNDGAGDSALPWTTPHLQAQFAFRSDPLSRTEQQARPKFGHQYVDPRRGSSQAAVYPSYRTLSNSQARQQRPIQRQPQLLQQSIDPTLLSQFQPISPSQSQSQSQPEPASQSQSKMTVPASPKDQCNIRTEAAVDILYDRAANQVANLDFDAGVNDHGSAIGSDADVDVDAYTNMLDDIWDQTASRKRDDDDDYGGVGGDEEWSGIGNGPGHGDFW